MLSEEYFSPANEWWMGHNWKGLGTKGFKTNRENELGKYFARLQTQKLTDEEWVSLSWNSSKCSEGTEM